MTQIVVTNGNGQLKSAVTELQARIKTLEEENQKLKSKTEFFDQFINLSDAVETEADAKKVLEFFDNLREEKLKRDRVEEAKSEAEDKERTMNDIYRRDPALAERDKKAREKAK